MKKNNKKVMNLPKISVVIPVCNVEKYVQKCVESVMAQTLKDIEIICVDDGSKDSSGAILDKLAAQDERIRVIHKQNTGYGNTMNIGMSEAKGEYIGIVESDDFIAKDMYEKLYSLSRKGKVDLVKGNFYDYYAEEGEAPEAVINTERQHIPDSKKSFTLCEEPEISWGHPSVWSAIYRRLFLVENEIHFQEEKGGWVDNPFFYETLCKARSIMWTGQPFYYHMKSSPTSSSNRQGDPRLPLQCMMENLDVLERNGVRDTNVNKVAYARALMYVSGVIEDFDYNRHSKIISEYARKLMGRLDENIFLDKFSPHDQLRYYSYSSPISSIQAKAPKILLYNWVPLDRSGIGGGVAIYCKNVVEALRKNTSAEIYFLSSGFTYTPAETRTFYQKRNFGSEYRFHQYEIVNSPVPADQRVLYRNPSVALENKTLKGVFADFLETYGPFEAIHFNNMEGLSLDVFDLKEQFSDTKFIYSIHNYIPVCVNGAYYMRHKHCNCHAGRTGEDCMACTRADIRSNLAREIYDRALFQEQRDKGSNEAMSFFRWTHELGLDRLDKDITAEHIQDFAKKATENISKNCDHILAVSQRVYEIAAENGMDEKKMFVSYIGTKVADRQLGRGAAKPGKNFKVVFLGNDINYEEKGYAFLLDALSDMEEEQAGRIDLVLTVRGNDHAEMHAMLRKFHSVKIINGYTHDDLPKIFAGAHLSLVPVLWEDNLPQIAIESVAYGVPVLASTAGGAKELSTSELFRFKCADAEDLRRKLAHFLEKPEDLQEYWSHHHGLVTMAEHWQELAGIYGLSSAENVSMTADDYVSLLKEHEFMKQYICELEAKNPGLANTNLAENLRVERKKNSELEAQVKKLEGKMVQAEAKAIFQIDRPLDDGAGISLFKIAVDDFKFSDFYAEIKFVSLGNLAPSYSDVLYISGSMLENEGTLNMQLHQMEWKNGRNALSNAIGVEVKGTEVAFWAKYNGEASGYLYQVETLGSRAQYDSAHIEKLHEGFVLDVEAIPAGVVMSHAANKNASAKVVFQTDGQEEEGVALFKLVLDDFNFSDFYAEVQFVDIANLSSSASDVLRISGSLLECEPSQRMMKIHQLEWKDGNTRLRDRIYINIQGNEVHFFGRHNGKASGYMYLVETLVSRASYASVNVVGLNEGFIYENEKLPEGAFRAGEA